MGKALLAVGILFLWIGIIFVAYSYYPVENVKERPLISRAEKEWEVSGNLSKGEKIIVAVVPSADWSIWAQELFAEPIKVNVSIIIEDPLGVAAEFKIFYEPPPLTYKHEDPGKPFPIFLSNPPFKLVNNGSLIVNEPLDFVGGIVTQSGTYRVRVVPTWWTEGPPEYIEIYTEILEKTYPYKQFLPLGVGLCIFGVAMIILRTKRSKAKRLRTRLRVKTVQTKVKA